MIDFFKTLMKIGCLSLFVEVGRMLAWACASKDIFDAQVLRAIDYRLTIVAILLAAVFVVGFVGYFVCAVREIRKNKKNDKKEDNSDKQ